MNHNEQELGKIVESAALPADASPARVQAVHTQVMKLAAEGNRPRGRLRMAGIAVILSAGVTAVGLAGTETGRDWVRSLFTPIEPSHAVTGTRDDNSSWIVSRIGPAADPFSAEETENVQASMDEVAALMKAGEGRLVGMMELPGMPDEPGAERILTVCQIEYTLSNGEKTSIGQQPTPAQAVRMRLAEIRKQRDAGEGEVVSKADFPMGLGKYVIRFTLDDDQTVDVETIFPPAPLGEREAIFSEIAALKAARRFTVLDANRLPDGYVSGLLRYTLSDGRVVGLPDSLPADVISADGKHVVMPQSETSTEILEETGR